MELNSPDELDRLFGSYREACPDLEGSANFVPGIWARIEAAGTMSWLPVLRLWARRVVAATALAAAALIFSSRLLNHAESVNIAELSYTDVLTADMQWEDQDLWLLAGNDR
jgi:hypothetical protein